MNVHELVLKRNYFYEKLVVYQVILMATLVIGTFINFYFFRVVYFDQLKPTYFTTTAEGRSLQDIPLGDPIYADEEIERWVSDKIVNIFSFNFFNYKSHMTRLGHDFDQIGYVEFMEALNQNRLITAIVRHKFLSRVYIEQPFKVRRHLPLNGRHGWVLQGHLLVEYVNHENRLNPFRQKMEMLVYVTRQSLFMYPQGIAFRTIIAK